MKTSRLHNAIGLLVTPYELDHREDASTRIQNASTLCAIVPT